jgi:hypoxanthine-DNA glycosylase
LADRGVALWDVVGEATRAGSLDGAIRDAIANPLGDFVESHPRLRAIAFNGQTAARIGRKGLTGTTIALIDLPSSSPAYTLPFDAKVIRWAQLGTLALPPKSGRIG